MPINIIKNKIDKYPCEKLVVLGIDCGRCRNCEKKASILSTLTAYIKADIKEMEGKMKEFKDAEKKHHEEFLIDEARYKANQNEGNLQKMKLHEGSISAYSGGRNDGNIEALSNLITQKKKDLEEIKKLNTGEFTQ